MGMLEFSPGATEITMEELVPVDVCLTVAHIFEGGELVRVDGGLIEKGRAVGCESGGDACVGIGCAKEFSEGEKEVDAP